VARCAALFNAARMFIGSTSTLYLISKGLSAADVMYLKAVQAAGLLLLEIPLGWWADRVGRKNPIIIGMLCGCAWLGITAAAGQVIWLFVAEIFNAASLALIGAALEAEFVDRYTDGLSADAHEAALTTGILHFTRLQYQAMAIAAGLGGIVYGITPTGTWSSAAILAAVSAVIFGLVYPSDRPPGAAATSHLQPVGASAVWRAVASSHRGALSVVIASGLLFASFQISIQYWQISLLDVGAGSADGAAGGALFGGVFVAILLVQSRVDAATRFMRRHKSIVAGLVVLAPTIWLVALLTRLPVPALAFAICAYFWLHRASMVVVDAYVNSRIPSHLRATIISARSTLARLMMLAVSPVVSAGVAKWSATGAVAVVGGLGVLGAVAILNINTRQRSDPEWEDSPG